MSDPEKEPNVPKEKSFDALYEESLSLLKGVLDNIDKQPINPGAPTDEIVKKLTEMEREFDEFLEASKGLFDVMGPQDGEGEAHIPKNVLRLLKKSQELQTRAEAKMEEIKATDALLQEAGQKKKEKKSSEKEAGRKNKFRRLGGNRGWKPL